MDPNPVIPADLQWLMWERCFASVHRWCIRTQGSRQAGSQRQWQKRKQPSMEQELQRRQDAIPKGHLTHAGSSWKLVLSEGWPQDTTSVNMSAPQLKVQHTSIFSPASSYCQEHSKSLPVLQMHCWIRAWLVLTAWTTGVWGTIRNGVGANTEGSHDC